VRTITNPSNLQIAEAMRWLFTDRKDVVFKTADPIIENGNRTVRVTFIEPENDRPNALRWYSDYNGSFGDLIMQGIKSGRMILTIPGDDEYESEATWPTFQNR